MCGATERASALLKLYTPDRKSTRLNSSHSSISYAVFCLIRPPPGSTLFPYTTLFRSRRVGDVFGGAPSPQRDRGGDALLRGRVEAAAVGRLDPARSQHVDPDVRRDRAGERPAEAVHPRSEEHTSELQSQFHLVCRLLLDPPAPGIYTLSLHDALPISPRGRCLRGCPIAPAGSWR